MMLIIVLVFSSNIFAAPLSAQQNLGCGEQGDCPTNSDDCTDICGCDKLYYYNETLDECLFNFEYLREGLREKYNIQDYNDFSILTEDSMANKISLEAERAFRGIVISAMIVAACATVGVVTACIYCFRIDYRDRKLNNEVKALAMKLKRDQLPKPKKIRPEPVAQSCSIIVEEAGVFVV